MTYDKEFLSKRPKPLTTLQSLTSCALMTNRSESRTRFHMWRQIGSTQHALVVTTEVGNLSSLGCVGPTLRHSSGITTAFPVFYMVSTF